MQSERLPGWQRLTGKICYPLLEVFVRRAFNPDPPHTQRAVERIETLLQETEHLLADGRKALLGGEATDFVDLTLASLSAPWVQPASFAAGAFPEVQIDPGRVPPKMRADMDRWRETFPLTTAHVERLYREERH